MKDDFSLTRHIHSRVTNSEIGRTPALILPPGEIPDSYKEAFIETELPKGNLLDILPSPEACEIIQKLEEDLIGDGPAVAFWSYDGTVRVLGDNRLVLLANCPGLYRDPCVLVDAVIDVRREIGSSRLLGLPGIATPQNVPFLSYIGGDVFDTPLMEMFAVSNVCFDGIIAASTGGSAIDQNIASIARVVLQTRSLIECGRLREVVEGTAAFSHKIRQGLAHADRTRYEHFESGWPVSASEFNATGEDTLTRPDITRHLNRLFSTYKPPERDILLLLPCSARKPYSHSRTHKTIGGVLNDTGKRGHIHEVIVTSPAIIVPREVESFHPAVSYDIAVTGYWSANEKEMIIASLNELIAKGNYKQIISHLPRDMSFVEEALGIEIITVVEHPLNNQSLSNLTSTLGKLLDGYDKPPKADVLLENITGILSYQFGSAWELLVAGAEARMNRGSACLTDAEGQIGIVSPERGTFTLTLNGAKRLIPSGKFQVEIEDFMPRGDIFAVGVDSATLDIRVGDEVLVMHKGDLRGIGVAEMHPWDMVELTSGCAVKVRHSKK